MGSYAVYSGENITKVAETKYFECHVTIDPVFSEEGMDTLRKLCEEYGFRIADLYKGNGEPNTRDMFMSARHAYFDSLDDLSRSFVFALEYNGGFRVRRRKIEAILIDERKNADK